MWQISDMWRILDFLLYRNLCHKKKQQQKQQPPNALLIYVEFHEACGLLN